MGPNLKVLALLSLLAAAPLDAATVPFSKAVDAALKHSGTMAIAAAEAAHAQASLAQARDAYIPMVVVGSGLGYSYGFPLAIEGAAPSVVNFNSTSMLLNFPQREYIKSARWQWAASSSDTLDKRNQVVLDTATAYFQLDQALAKMKVLKDEEDAAHRAEFITTQRVQQGIDSQLELTKAQLSSAQVRMRVAQVQSDIDVLREHLSKLTGIAAADFTTDPASLPKIPEVRQDEDLSSMAIANSPAIKAADQKAGAAEARARAEHKAWLPTVDFGTQYALLAQYNNYSEFYKTYQRNNFSVGVNIRFPFYVASQRRAAEAADADAIKAKKEADLARDQVTEDTLKLQRNLAQLSAATEVARLQYEVTKSGVTVAEDRLQSGNATMRDVENARLQASDAYSGYLDAQLQMEKAQMQLLRLTGDIYNWSRAAK